MLLLSKLWFSCEGFRCDNRNIYLVGGHCKKGAVCDPCTPAECVLNKNNCTVLGPGQQYVCTQGLDQGQCNTLDHWIDVVTKNPPVCGGCCDTKNCHLAVSSKTSLRAPSGRHQQPSVSSPFPPKHPCQLTHTHTHSPRPVF